MTPTWLRRMRAEWGGYFWLPCPLCGQYFGGNEWRLPHQSLRYSTSSSRAVCRDCAGSEAVMESERYWDAILVEEIRKEMS